MPCLRRLLLCRRRARTTTRRLCGNYPCALPRPCTTRSTCGAHGWPTKACGRSTCCTRTPPRVTSTGSSASGPTPARGRSRVFRTRRPSPSPVACAILRGIPARRCTSPCVAGPLRLQATRRRPTALLVASLGSTGTRRRWTTPRCALRTQETCSRKPPFVGSCMRHERVVAQPESFLWVKKTMYYSRVEKTS